MLKYGLIGSGMMGQEHIRNVALVDGVEVAAIFEPDAGMRREAARLAPGAAFVGSVAALLERTELDALVIASPNNLHVRQIADIMERRPLPLLVEKPLFTDREDAALIERFVTDYPAPVWVAMEYRYMPPIARLVADAAEATGGVMMLTIREHRFPFLTKVGDWNRFNRNTGGTLVEKCCHFFDLMRLILADEPTLVMASGGQSVNHLDETYWGETPDIWDNAYVIAEFAGGARAMLELCMFADGSRYQEEICAVGPAGKIEVRVPGPKRFWPVGEPEPVAEMTVSPRLSGRRGTELIPVDPRLLDSGDHNGATYFEHLRFARVVRGLVAPEVSLRDGERAVAMALAAHTSAETGKAVEVG